MKRVKHFFEQNTYPLLGAIFVLTLFCYITVKTPLAGDDWGYCLNGQSGNPIELTIAFYNNWSGRIFSEFYGFTVACRKWLYNILNPLTFTLIFLFAYRLGRVKKKKLSAVLLMLAIMLSVDDNLRMETYTWLMGYTYVLPLCLALGYLCICDQMFKCDIMSRRVKVFSVLSNLLLFVIGLMMENIAATMIVAVVFMLVYAFFNKRRILPYLSLNLVFSILSFAICRLSPGAHIRMIRDSAEWASQSVFEKIASAYPNFLEMSFIKNNYLIAIFSIVVILLLWFSKHHKHPVLRILLSLVMLAGMVTVFSFVLHSDLPMQHGNSLYSMLFWPVYILSAFVSIFISFDANYYRDKTLFMLILAGTSVLVMLMSPIYGSRSALYLVYFLIVVIILINDAFELPRFVKYILPVLMLAILFDRTNEYLTKYNLVGKAQAERLEILQYYREHPEDEEAWIPRFPIYTVHGADVEIGDDYHFETFKEYYQIPQSPDKIIFYYKETD